MKESNAHARERAAWMACPSLVPDLQGTGIRARKRLETVAEIAGYRSVFVVSQCLAWLISQLEQFCMTGIAFVNQLYGQEELKRLQRKEARFINTGLIVTLSGAVNSDALEDGRVVSVTGEIAAEAHASAVTSSTSAGSLAMPPCFTMLGRLGLFDMSTSCRGLPQFLEVAGSRR